MFKLRYVLITVFVILILVTACDENPFDPDGWHSTSRDGFKLRWRISSSNLEVELTGPSTGWVAVGFGGSYLMHDANIIIGYVSGSSANIRDDFGIDSNTHESDSDLQGGEQNVSSKSGSESSGQTEIEFTIPLDSGDIWDVALTEGQKYNIVFICGEDSADDFTSDYETITSTSITL